MLIVSLVDLKSGYWLLELTEESKVLTTLTVGLLGFYKGICMLFGLTKGPATFQHLMENCLGDMHLNWCIIYLYDEIVFFKGPTEHLKRLRGVF